MLITLPWPKSALLTPRCGQGAVLTNGLDLRSARHHSGERRQTTTRGGSATGRWSGRESAARTERTTQRASPTAGRMTKAVVAPTAAPAKPAATMAAASSILRAIANLLVAFAQSCARRLRGTQGMAAQHRDARGASGFGNDLPDHLTRSGLQVAFRLSHASTAAMPSERQAPGWPPCGSAGCRRRSPRSHCR